MTTVNTYLNFDGNCEVAFKFYQSVFGGEFSYIGKFNEMPKQEGMPPLSEVDKNKIMHISLLIGNTILMGSDTIGEWSSQFKQGNNFSISIHPESKEEANRLFSALSKDGQVIMPLDYTFWGAYYGMCIDKFGINWMINLDLNTK